MKFSTQETKILFILSAIIGLYDFFNIPFNSFLITSVFAGLIYGFTKSPYFIAFVYLIPQFIKLINFLLGKKEKFQNANAISNRLQTNFKLNKNKQYNNGVNLNPETPTKEYFQDVNSVSQRVEKIMKNNAIKKSENPSGLVDVTESTGEYPKNVDGIPSYPNFMEATANISGTDLTTNTRINTIPESNVPAVGTVENKMIDRPYISTYDDISISTALKRTTNDNPLLYASNLKSVDM